MDCSFVSEIRVSLCKFRFQDPEYRRFFWLQRNRQHGDLVSPDCYQAVKKGGMDEYHGGCSLERPGPMSSVLYV